MAPFHITEARPSIMTSKEKKRTFPIGRGGYGNHIEPTTPSSQPTTTISPNALERTSSSNGNAPSRNSSDSSALSVKTSSSSSSTRSTGSKVFLGRGGAGNALPANERRIFSFDEELERQLRLEEAASKTRMVRIGRGGAGNFVKTK